MSRTVGSQSRTRLVGGKRAVFLFLSVFLQYTAVHSQAPETIPTSPVPAIEAEVSIETVQKQLEGVDQLTQLDDAAKEKLRQIYNQTLEQLKSAEDWDRKAAEFVQAATQAPILVEELQTQLAEPVQISTPEISDEMTSTQIEQKIAQEEANLQALRAKVTQLDERIVARVDRRTQLPDLIAQERQRLEELRLEKNTPVETTESAELAAAQQMALLSRERYLVKMIAAYENELLTFDVRGDLLTLQRDQAEREVEVQEQIVASYREALTSRRREEAEKAEREARKARTEIAKATDSPFVAQIISDLAQANASLAERRTGPEGLLNQIATTSERVQSTQQLLEQLKKDFVNIQSRVDTVGLNNVIGLMLQKKKAALPNVRAHQRNIRLTQQRIGQIQIEGMQIHDERKPLTNLDSAVRRFMNELPEEVSEEQRTSLQPRVREMLQTKRKYLDDLLQDLKNYFQGLVDLDSKERELIQQTKRFNAYIDELVLWIPSSSTLMPSTLHPAFQVLRTVLSPREWAGVFRAFVGDLSANAPVYMIAFAAFGILISLRGRMRGLIRESGVQASKPHCITYRHTLESVFHTVLFSLSPPLVLGFLGWRLTLSVQESDFVRVIGDTIVRMAILYFGFELVRQLCRGNGILVSHFGWPEEPVRRVRQSVTKLLGITLLSYFFIALSHSVEIDKSQESLSRLLFLLFMGYLAFLARKLLYPQASALREILLIKQSVGAQRLPLFFYLAGILIPSILLLLAFFGYFYTAWRLFHQLLFTIGLALIVLVIYGLILRWLLLLSRKLARERARRKRELLRAKEGEADSPAPPEEEIDLSSVDLQTQRLARSIVALVLAVGIFYVWEDEIPALNILEKVEVWETTQLVSETQKDVDGQERVFTTDKVVPITLANFALAILVGIVTWVAIRNLPGLLEIAILQKLRVGSGERYAITNALRYLLIALGIILAFNAIGIGWSKVQWLVAALSLGLGFGLQEIFANFISGLILLFERPIRVGDTVTIGGINGTVSKIHIRATTITDFDRKELIVPNKEFVTGQLVNWTLSDPILRIVVPVGIAYGSDTECAVETLYQVAKDEPTVLEDPAPVVVFYTFGASSLDFELRVYVQGIDRVIPTRHALHMAIDKAFRKAEIEIAFPQNDLHIRSVDTAVYQALQPQKPQEGS